MQPHPTAFPSARRKRARKPVPERKLVPQRHGMSVDGPWFEAPIVLVSETNMREHWRARHRRRAHQRQTIALLARALIGPVPMPREIKIVRIAPRPLDGHDNLRASAKAVVDGLADWLGIRDDDPRVTWSYGQGRREPKTYGVLVQVLP